MTQQSLILAAESNGRLDVNLLDYSILAFYFAIVVAIGVLFFVAWRFGPGEATTPPVGLTTITRTTTERNANQEIVAGTTATTEADRPKQVTRAPVKLRVDVDPGAGTTWVKITRLSTGKVIAEQEVEAGGHLGGGALEGR